MIKKTCDRCGKERTKIHQNTIESFTVSIPKTSREFKRYPKDSHGRETDCWTVRVSPMGAALCRACILRMWDNPAGTFSDWIHEGDYPDEYYAPVQTPVEASVPRFKSYADWQVANGDRTPTMALLLKWAVRVLKTEEEAAEDWSKDPWRPLGY